MRKFKIGKIFWVAFIAVALVAGCGREQAPVVVPAVIATSPANLATAVPLNATISATFNLAMDSATINATTFTLTGPGGVGVTGTVTYAGNTATFTPAVLLGADTSYVATITTAAQSTRGNALAANFMWSFTTASPTVISTVPAAGATGVGINTVISATFSEPMNPATINGVTFTVTGPGVTPVAGVVTYAGSTATFTPTGLLAANTSYTAMITTGAQDPGGVALAANFMWTFMTAAPPTVVSTVPAAGATAVAVNTLVSATFSRAMNPATINGGTFTLTGPGVTPVNGAVTYSGNTATFTPTTVLAANTLFTATISVGATDPSGSPLAASFVWTFMTAAAPTVVSTIPANGATAVALNTVVSATFSEAMDPTTLNGTTFTLTGPGTAPVPGAVTYAGDTATFTPTAALEGGTLFTATITTGAADPTGNALAVNHVWTFTTVSQPKVTSTNPASGATNVPINQKITATFDEPMSSATITAAGTFTVTPTLGGAAVTGTVTYDAASRTAIFTPSANLAVSTEFTGTIMTTAQDAAGSALGTAYTWNFTTGTVANATQPTVISTDPINLATLVPLNQTITATFGKAMDPATISAAGTFTVVTTVGAVAVPGVVTYDTASNTAIFTPSANLAASTQYTAAISNPAKDLSGNALIAASVANPWNFTTGTTANAAGPSITLENPANAATLVPIDATINATFSAAMNPATITTGTFLVTVTADGTPVSGTVAYNAASQIATFTPSANLLASTQFTATISPAVQDLNGNALAAGVAPNPWNFTTGTTAGGPGPATVNLGSAGNFAVLATASTTSTGPVVVHGDVGLNPGAAQGIPTAQVIGTIHVDDSIAAQAQVDLLAAYNDAKGRTANSQTLPGDMGGLTFTPGLYTNSTSVAISTNVTLDAQGDPNAVFIFQMGTTLTTTGGSVILAGGAQAGNIFWVVGSSATLSAPLFQGNILADVSITQNGGVVVNGRLFAGSGPGGSGTVVVNGVSVNVPQP